MRITTRTFGAYLALTVEDVFVFHAHAFNIALLLAVDPPTAQEAETKPGTQWEASPPATRFP